MSGEAGDTRMHPGASRADVGLSGQERLVAELVCCGLSNKQIAARSGLSEHTVSSYLRRVYGKVGVHSRVGLVTFMHAAAGAAMPTIFPGGAAGWQSAGD